jgi:cation-transporting ATPase E
MELAELDETRLEKAAEETTIFGRISPGQKKRLMEILRHRGRYVAMIGDGVNDVLALKRANLGIAMQSGSAATRGVADMVLLNDSFSALPAAFLEGQRIINGMKDILRLFLTRALYFALLIISTAMIGVGFPYVPKHATLVTLFSVGIPTFALASWARPGEVPKGSLVRSVMHFILPASVTIFAFGLLIYTGIFGVTYSDAEGTAATITQEEIDRFRASAGIDYPIESPQELAQEKATLVAQSALTTFTLVAGLILIIFVEPPAPFFVGGDTLSGDIRPTILAAASFLFFLAVMAIPAWRDFFELLLLPAHLYAAIGTALLLWMFALRFLWRANWFERFLRLDPQWMRKRT